MPGSQEIYPNLGFKLFSIRYKPWNPRFGWRLEPVSRLTFWGGMDKLENGYRALLPEKLVLIKKGDETKMAIMDSKTGQTVKQYSIEELQEAANLMRGYSLIALGAAGSGHSGGTLSIMDITAAERF